MSSPMTVLCPPMAPRLRPSAAPMKVPEFPLLEELELEPLELNAVELQVQASAPAAPRLRPAAPPVDICALPLLELPALAEEVESCTLEALDSFTLDEPAPGALDSFTLDEPALGAVDSFSLDGPALDTEEAAVFVSPEQYIFDAPKASSAGSASTAASSPRSARPPADGLLEELLDKQLEDPASPPSAPRLRPGVPPVDIFLMPDLELPPAAEDSETGAAEVEEVEEEEQVIFMLHGFDDDGLEHASSEHGSVSPSLFGSSPSDDSLQYLYHEAPTKTEVMKGCGDEEAFGHMTPLLVRATSSCSTRAPSPQKELGIPSPSSLMSFLPDLMLA